MIFPAAINRLKRSRKYSDIFVVHHEETPLSESTRTELCFPGNDAQRLLLSLICHSGLDPESSVSKSQRPEDHSL